MTVNHRFSFLLLSLLLLSNLVVAYVPPAVRVFAYAGEHAYTEISSDADILPGVPVIVGIPNVAGVHDVPVVSANVAVYLPLYNVLVVANIYAATGIHI